MHKYTNIQNTTKYKVQIIQKNPKNVHNAHAQKYKINTIVDPFPPVHPFLSNTIQKYKKYKKHKFTDTEVQLYNWSI